MEKSVVNGLKFCLCVKDGFVVRRMVLVFSVQSSHGSHQHQNATKLYCNIKIIGNKGVRATEKITANASARKSRSGANRTKQSVYGLGEKAKRQ
jgi:hypothetical protein